MSRECANIHRIICNLPRHYFPFDESLIPLNGIYVLFQKGEIGHDQDRIVRIGTHTGNNQLRSRLKQHFLIENKDRSIFRKNIGRALLNKSNDSFLKYWEIDLTSRKVKNQYASLIDFDYQKQIESEVSQYIRTNFSFVVFELEDKSERLETESRLISIISLCDECFSSDNWLGKYSPKVKILKSGLWQVNELYKIPFDVSSIEGLSMLIKG